MVLIGGASHPILLHRGFGVISAIEDAACWGVLVNDGGGGGGGGEDEGVMAVDVENVEGFLSVFEQVRLPKTAVCQLYSQVRIRWKRGGGR